MRHPELIIVQKFRGGKLSYREGNDEVPFEWEFGGTVIAIIWGTKKHVWDIQHPWAKGRQSEIFDFVAKEVIRQKASTSDFRIDLEGGMITIL